MIDFGDLLWPTGDPILDAINEYDHEGGGLPCGYYWNGRNRLPGESFVQQYRDSNGVIRTKMIGLASNP